MPRLALRPEGQDAAIAPVPYLEERETHDNMTCKLEAKGTLLQYRQKNNLFSLDGLPALKDAMKRNGYSFLGIKTRIWVSQNRKTLENLGFLALGMGLGVGVMAADQWKKGNGLQL